MLALPVVENTPTVTSDIPQDERDRLLVDVLASRFVPLEAIDELAGASTMASFLFRRLQQQQGVSNGSRAVDGPQRPDSQSTASDTKLLPSHQIILSRLREIVPRLERARKSLLPLVKEKETSGATMTVVPVCLLSIDEFNALIRVCVSGQT